MVTSRVVWRICLGFRGLPQASWLNIRNERKSFSFAFVQKLRICLYRTLAAEFAFIVWTKFRHACSNRCSIGDPLNTQYIVVCDSEVGVTVADEMQRKKKKAVRLGMLIGISQRCEELVLVTGNIEIASRLVLEIQASRRGRIDGPSILCSINPPLIPTWKDTAGNRSKWEEDAERA